MQFRVFFFTCRFADIKPFLLIIEKLIISYCTFDGKFSELTKEELNKSTQF